MTDDRFRPKTSLQAANERVSNILASAAPEVSLPRDFLLLASYQEHLEVRQVILCTVLFTVLAVHVSREEDYASYCTVNYVDVRNVLSFVFLKYDLLTSLA
jgi:hypothetical protein